MTHRNANFDRGALRQDGFTLIEFLITVSVLVIVLGIAAPSFGAFVARNQTASVKSAFMGSVALARAEAARTGSQVLLKAGSGGSAGNEFANGWDLIVDADGSGTQTSGDTVLRHYEALPATIRLQGTSTLVFTASGYLTPATNIDYRVCPASGSSGYSVSVAPSGIAYSAVSGSCS